MKLESLNARNFRGAADVLESKAAVARVMRDPLVLKRLGGSAAESSATAACGVKGRASSVTCIKLPEPPERQNGMLHAKKQQISAV